jgi:cytochrome c oxidase subunit 1
MMGGTIIALMAGLHHWWPKMFGKMYSQFWANIGAVIVFIGFNVTFFTQFFMGVQGMPRRYASYVEDFQIYHQISTIGSYILAVGFFTHLFVFIHSLALGKKAAQNPWGGLTMEWAADSPPIEHNFAHEPVCTHGPYDFDRVVPPGWKAADWPLPDGVKGQLSGAELTSHSGPGGNSHH